MKKIKIKSVKALKELFELVENATKRKFPEVEDLDLHEFDWDRRKTIPRYALFKTLHQGLHVPLSVIQNHWPQRHYWNPAESILRSIPYYKNVVSKNWEIPKVLNKAEIKKALKLSREALFHDIEEFGIEHKTQPNVISIAVKAAKEIFGEEAVKGKITAFRKELQNKIV